MLPPTEGTLAEFQNGVGSNNFNRKGIDQRRQEQQEGEKGWPQVLVEELKELASVIGAAKHPAKDSFKERREETLLEFSQLGGSGVGGLHSLLIFQTANHMLFSGMVSSPTTLAILALGAPMVHDIVNHLGSGFTSFRSSPFARASRSGRLVSTTTSVVVVVGLVLRTGRILGKMVLGITVVALLGSSIFEGAIFARSLLVVGVAVPIWFVANG
jgi:hypothetical protein